MSHPRIAAALATAAAAVLVALLIVFSGVSFEQFVDRLSALGTWQIAACLIGIGTPVVLASIKWRGVVKRVLPAGTAAPGFPFFFHFSALSGLLGQFITPYAAGPIVRGIALRRADKGGFLFGASTSVLEQFFDAWASLVFAGAGILMLVAGLPAELAMIGYAIAAAIGSAGAVFLIVVPSSGPVLAFVGRMLPALRGRLEQFNALRQRSSLASLGFVSWLYWISVLRFWVLGFAVIGVASTFSESWSVASLLHVYAAAQITRFAVFTPGNLGLAEWGWTTVLAIYGWGFQSAALFALTFRVVGLVFTCAVYVIAGAIYLALNRLLER